MQLPGGVRKERNELGETSLPKHLLGVYTKTQVADAEKTHCEPTSSVHTEGITLNISLIAKEFLGLSTAPSLWHHAVQLPMVCRVVNNGNNTPHQPGSQMGVVGGQGKKEENTS